MEKTLLECWDKLSFVGCEMRGIVEALVAAHEGRCPKAVLEAESGRSEPPPHAGVWGAGSSNWFFPGNREISKKNRAAIERERAITERD
jgi:hypothetical protein